MGRKGTGSRGTRPQKKFSLIEISKKVRREYAQEMLEKKRQKELEIKQEKNRRKKLIKRFRFNYRPSYNVLLVGEANCSFARSIIRQYRKTIARRLKKRGIPLPKAADIMRGVDPDLESLAATSFSDDEEDMEEDMEMMMDEDDEMVYDEDDEEAEEVEVTNNSKPKKTPQPIAYDDDDEEEEMDDEQDDEQDDEDEENYDDEDKDEEEGDRLFDYLFSNCGRNMIVTCYDSLNDAIKKYEDLPEILSELYSAGVRVIFDVDCTNMYQTLTQANLIPKQKFDRISFNFPHVGSGQQDKELAVRENQQLILAYLTNSLPMLRKATTSDSELMNTGKKKPNSAGKWDRGGQVSVTIKNGMPYDNWRIPVLARMLNHNQAAAQQIKEDSQQRHPGSLASRFPKLMLFKVLPFLHECYDGYAHRRTIGFKSGLSKLENEEITGPGAKTFIFVRAPVGYIDKGLGIGHEDNGVKQDTTKKAQKATLGKRNKSGRANRFKAKRVQRLQKKGIL